MRYLITSVCFFPFLLLANWFVPSNSKPIINSEGEFQFKKVYILSKDSNAIKNFDFSAKHEFFVGPENIRQARKFITKNISNISGYEIIEIEKIKFLELLRNTGKVVLNLRYDGYSMVFFERGVYQGQYNNLSKELYIESKLPGKEWYSIKSKGRKVYYNNGDTTLIISLKRRFKLTSWDELDLKNLDVSYLLFVNGVESTPNQDKVVSFFNYEKLHYEYLLREFWQ